MAEGSLRTPLNVIACRLCNEEWFGAARVAIAVDAGLDCVIEDGARCNFGCYLSSSTCFHKIDVWIVMDGFGRVVGISKVV